MSTIAQTAVFYGHVDCPDDVTIGDYCVLGTEGETLEIPAGSTIGSHTCIEAGVEFAGPFMTGHHCLIRPGVRIGAHLKLGSYSSLEGGMEIGDYTRLLGRFQAGTQGLDPPVRIGHFVTCYSGVMMADNRHPGYGPPEPAQICDGAVLGMGAFVMPGVRIGVGAVVAAQAVVNRSVPDGTVFYRGPRMRFVDELVSADGRRGPWTGHRDHGYPPEAQDRIDDLHWQIVFSIERGPALAMAAAKTPLV
jgi:acetyltransferase-like isoleucine patch superfamily enzyme